MQLIPLEEVKNMMNCDIEHIKNNKEYYGLDKWMIKTDTIEETLNQIEYIQSIDPIAIIDEMIEELELLQPEQWKLAKKDTLQELKSRLTNNN